MQSRPVKSRRKTWDPADAVKLSVVVDDALELCREKLFKNNVKFEVSGINSDVILVCRAVQLTQVILNLNLIYKNNLFSLRAYDRRYACVNKLKNQHNFKKILDSIYWFLKLRMLRFCFLFFPDRVKLFLIRYRQSLSEMSVFF